MLPFLKPKKASVAGVIIQNRNPDKANESEDLESSDSLEDIAQDLINAIQSQDKQAVVVALRAAIKQVDQEPHIEGEHEKPSPHSYEAQKED